MIWYRMQDAGYTIHDTWHTTHDTRYTIWYGTGYRRKDTRYMIRGTWSMVQLTDIYDGHSAPGVTRSHSDKQSQRRNPIYLTTMLLIGKPTEQMSQLTTKILGSDVVVIWELPVYMILFVWFLPCPSSLESHVVVVEHKKHRKAAVGNKVFLKKAKQTFKRLLKGTIAELKGQGSSFGPSTLLGLSTKIEPSIQRLGNWHALTTDAVSQGHMILFYDLLTSKVDGKAGFISQPCD